MATPVKYRSFPPNLLEEIRDHFFYVDVDPFSGPRVFFESASGSLRLQSVVQAMAKETALPDQLGRANPGSKHANEMMDRGIEGVKLFLGAQSGTIMAAMSSTHAIFRAVNAVASGVPGTNIVTTQLEHPSVYDSTRLLAEQTGKEWRVAGLSAEDGSVAPDAILEQIDPDTCLLALIHASNVTGAILDVQTVIEEARKIKPDLYVLVDGVQYAPHAPVDVEELGVDAYVFGPYKVFCAKGIGFAYLSERLAALPHWKLCGKAAPVWELGSPEHATYAAWASVVDYLCWLGGHFTLSAERREQLVAGMVACNTHDKALLHRALYGEDEVQGLLDMDHVTVYGMGGDLTNRVCLIGFNLKGADAEEGVQRYKRQNIRVHNRTRDAYSKHVLDALGVEQVIRLSACHYNTLDEIDRFLEVTASFG